MGKRPETVDYFPGRGNRRSLVAAPGAVAQGRESDPNLIECRRAAPLVQLDAAPRFPSLEMVWDRIAVEKWMSICVEI